MKPGPDLDEDFGLLPETEAERRARQMQEADASKGALPSPAEVMQFLDQAAGELDSLGKRLEAAHVSMGDAESAWEEAKDIELLRIVEESEGRLPGEDVRLALARKRIGFQPYRDYIKAKALVKGIEGHVRRVEKAISARQSTLKGIREESMLHHSGFTGGGQ